MQPERYSQAVGGRTIEVELYRPAGHGPWPGVLLLHELFGLTSQVRADARHLAREGYLVLAPDLYAEGMARYCMKFFFSRAALANRADAEPVREVHRLLDALKVHPACNGRLGVVGMCMSGGFALQMARRDDVAAPVVFHHSFGGLTDAEAADVTGVVQGHFAAGDKICTAAKVATLAAQLGDHLEANVYEGVGHGLRSAFRHTPQSAESWSRTLAFFREQLS